MAKYHRLGRFISNRDLFLTFWRLGSSRWRFRRCVVKIHSSIDIFSLWPHLEKRVRELSGSFLFLAMPYGLWDLNSPTRDWTWGHGRELDSREFSLGPLMLLCFCLVNMLCPTFCHPMGSPPGSSVHGISQARILEQTEFPSPGFLPLPGIEPASPALTGGFFTTEPPGKCWGYVL